MGATDPIRRLGGGRKYYKPLLLRQVHEIIFLDKIVIFWSCWIEIKLKRRVIQSLHQHIPYQNIIKTIK